VNFRDLSEQEKGTVLFEVEQVSKESMKAHPKVTVITLKRPLRMVSSAHKKITKEKALGWIAHAMITGPKYDRCFHVETYPIKLSKEFQEFFTSLGKHYRTLM
jgi:hypothetical protein